MPKLLRIIHTVASVLIATPAAVLTFFALDAYIPLWAAVLLSIASFAGLTALIIRGSDETA